MPTGKLKRLKIEADADADAEASASAPGLNNSSLKWTFDYICI